jgi:Flp pilus assembly protein TadG
MSTAKRYSSFLVNTSGNMLLLTVLSLTTVLGAAGATIDFVNTSHRQTALQTAIDTAALAGVLEEASEMKMIAAAHAIYETNTKNLKFKVSKKIFKFVEGTMQLHCTASFQSSNAIVSLVGISSKDIVVNASYGYENTSAFCIHALSASASSALIFNNKRGPLMFTGPSVDAPNVA